MVLKTPLLMTFLRKRLSKESCDSPLRKLTMPNEITYFPHGNDKEIRPLHSIGRGVVHQVLKRTK